MAGTPSELLAGMHAERPSVPKPLPEAIVMELREAFARYGLCPFKPGDLVTPSPGSNLNGVGEPHIVLETLPGALPDFANGKAGTNEFGSRHDMRVLCRGDSSCLFAHWVEAWAFVPWTGEST